MSFFKKIALFLIALSAFLLPACGGSDNEDDNNGNDGEQELVTSVKSSRHRQFLTSINTSNLNSFVLNQYDLNFDLFRASKDQIKQNNAIISTISLQMAFAMVWAGSQSNTYSGIQEALHFDENTRDCLNWIYSGLNKANVDAVHEHYEGFDPKDYDAIEIKLSNNLYLPPLGRWKWSEDWLDELAINYDAGIEEANFAADPEGVRQYINNVISRDTHDRIQNFLPDGSVTADTKAVITNAIYFKAPWHYALQKLSDQKTFTKLDNSSVNTDFYMNSNHFAYSYYAAEKYEAVSMSFWYDDFQVLFILPEAGQFEAVEQSLSADDIDAIFTNLKVTPMQIVLPAFSFNTSLNLTAPLQSLGMVTPFSPEEANFSKMTPDKNDFFIDQVYQKTFIDLDDKGVEADISTVLEDSLGSTSKTLTLDHPFFFVIYHKSTKSPLFFGRLMDPTAK